jgi:1,4-dihydroxy-6-naphthoate synthase
VKFTLAFSPCPNDTFIFDALINRKIDTGGIEFEIVLDDVETLNKWAIEGKHDITKLSFPAFFGCMNDYVLLNAGSALGAGVGPLMISRVEDDPAPIESSTIALPGEHTTANLLFNFAFPSAGKKIFKIFSEIENAVVTSEAQYGVIIHENRFTYQEKGLHKKVDLGEYWEQKMKVPVPLGGIAIKRSVDPSIAFKINELIRKSIEAAYAEYPSISEFVKQHSQTMSEEVMRQHINLYVNHFSFDLTDEGRKAIRILYEVYNTSRGIQETRDDLFINSTPRG